MDGLGDCAAWNGLGTLPEAPAPNTLAPPTEALTPPPKALAPPTEALTPPPKALAPATEALTPPPKALAPPVILKGLAPGKEAWDRGGRGEEEEVLGKKLGGTAE